MNFCVSILQFLLLLLYLIQLIPALFNLQWVTFTTFLQSLFVPQIKLQNDMLFCLNIILLFAPIFGCFCPNIIVRCFDAITFNLNYLTQHNMLCLWCISGMSNNETLDNFVYSESNCWYKKQMAH